MLKCFFYFMIIFAIYAFKNNLIKKVKKAAEDCIVNNPEIADFCNDTGLKDNNKFVLCFKEKLKTINNSEKYKTFIDKFIDFMVGLIYSKLKSIQDMVGMGDTNMINQYACNMIRKNNITSEDLGTLM